MAIYLDQRVDNGLGDSTLPPQRLYELLEWHAKHDLLAVASHSSEQGGNLQFFGDNVRFLRILLDPENQGKRTQDSAVNRASHRMTCLRWHPERDILAIGWENGDTQLWHRNDG